MYSSCYKKVTNKVLYWRQCWMYVWEENMWIKCFPWETKKFTLVWQWSIYMFPWFQCACSLLLLPLLILAAVLKFALPSLILSFLHLPFLSPSLQNKINWIFITELKALSLLYWWEQYCSIWLNKLLQPLWFSGHFWCKKYFFIYAYLFPWLSFPPFFCFVPIEFFLNRKLGNWRSLYLLCVKQCCKA